MPRSRLVTASVVVVLAGAALAFGVWFFLIRGDEPAEVSLADAIASVTDTTATAAATGATGTTEGT